MNGEVTKAGKTSLNHKDMVNTYRLIEYRFLYDQINPAFLVCCFSALNRWQIWDLILDLSLC